MSSSYEDAISAGVQMGQSLRKVREKAGLSRDKIVDLLDERGMSTNTTTLIRFEEQDNKNLVLCMRLLSLYREIGTIGPDFFEQFFHDSCVDKASAERRCRLIRQIINMLPRCDLGVIEYVAEQVEMETNQAL